MNETAHDLSHWSNSLSNPAKGSGQQRFRIPNIYDVSVFNGLENVEKKV
jgi:hypothetical protein